MIQKPLLSICIPTYNRANYLAKSLDSLICLPEFHSSEVEIVISDNASTDDTKQVVKTYSDKYKNIYYYRNDTNIRDKNFPTVIKLANGIFRKLSNDSLLYNKDYLSYLLDTIRQYEKNRPFIFFLNNNLKKRYKNMYLVNNIDDFLKICSFYITWLGGFGFWEDDILLVDNWFEGYETFLWQTKVGLEILSKKDTMVVLNKKMTMVQLIEKRDISYGLYHVFYENYLDLIHNKVKEHSITPACFAFLRKDLLMNFFPAWVVKYRLNKANYIILNDDNIENLLRDAYKDEKYFAYFLVKIEYYFYKKKLKHLIFFIVNKIKCLISIAMHYY